MQPLTGDNAPTGTPAEQARQIFARSRDYGSVDGKRVVELLLAGREMPELSSEELELLAQGYKWCGKNDEALEAARLNLAIAPSSQENLLRAGAAASNAFYNDLPGFVGECDRCIAERLGPAAFWQLLKADQYIAFATGERELDDYEWSDGDSILHPDLLRQAANALAAAIQSEPELCTDESPGGWGGDWDRRDWNLRFAGLHSLWTYKSSCGWVGDWNLRFAAVLEQPEFRHLRM